MAVLQKINNLKPLIKEIEDTANEVLPADLKDEALEAIKGIETAITETTELIEKYYQDKRLIQNMEKSLYDQMKKEEIYNGFNTDTKKEIVDKIIADPDLDLLRLDDLKEFIQDQLRTGTVEDLIKSAYTKNQIIQLGDAVTDEKNPSELVQYEAGLDILQDMAQTPTGREETVTQALKRSISIPELRNNYISLYYGL